MRCCCQEEVLKISSSDCNCIYYSRQACMLYRDIVIQDCLLLLPLIYIHLPVKQISIHSPMSSILLFLVLHLLMYNFFLKSFSCSLLNDCMSNIYRTLSYSCLCMMHCLNSAATVSRKDCVLKCTLSSPPYT